MTRPSLFRYVLLILLGMGTVLASEREEPIEREYVEAKEAPGHQSQMEADAKSKGCISCHTKTDRNSMHDNEAVTLGCVDCHGGNEKVVASMALSRDSSLYRGLMDQAHVQPRFPEFWQYPSSRNPEISYARLNDESPEFIRFMNPSDYRIVRQACGACHTKQIQAAERSIMSTGAMLWGGGAYNNGVLPFKKYVLGEYYQVLTGDARKDAEESGAPLSISGILKANVPPDANMAKKGVLPLLAPLPAYEVFPPADIFRVFERGGRLIGNTFSEVGLPNDSGSIQRLDEPGRPDIRQSNRGPGTGARIAIPVLNITKTRLNDPFTWFLGTNDNPGDYRNSGCASCHVVYGNDRDPRHSGPYAKFGHHGTTQSVDPTIPRGESGHPLKHEFTRAIPTSQCMICHMHQPNVFVNSFLGYTMWDYESDAPEMWPKEQRYLNAGHASSGTDVSPEQIMLGLNVKPEQIIGDDKAREIASHNPEEAAQRGLWSDRDFLSKVWDKNPSLKDTQFADYHGHGWNFRAIFKRDREGTLLDKEGNKVQDTDPAKFQKAVHLSSIHLDLGMHCVDCHFEQDSHGNGHMYGEVAQAIEIDCVDCHGTADRLPNLLTSGPSAPRGGSDLSALRTQDGRKRFEWRGNDLYQRSALWPDREWRVKLVKNTVNPNHKDYNAKAARAKTVTDDPSQEWGPGVDPAKWAHKNEKMTCFTCHSSWATSCGGCHLPIQANWKAPKHHYESKETRNFATYNPQVARDDMFQIGKHGPAKGGRIAPVRSSSALVLSSRNVNRELIYIQQPPISASGFSSQAFAPHYPHTERTVETKTCTDCHLSKDNDNNAIMAQLLLQGTNFVNFLGYNAWLGTDNSVVAATVTEWDEPQAVIGSFLHHYAYPDWFKQHRGRGRVLQEGHDHRTGGRVGCLQLRGEYLYVAQGEEGFEAYDVANIANKGFSQRIVDSPFSSLGHNTQIKSENATCVALPTNQPIHPARRHLPGFGLDAEAMTNLIEKTNLEQKFHPIYNYAFITDSEEGLILVDVNTLADGEPRNNFLERELTWNEGGILQGARHIVIGGHYAYIVADAGLVVLDMNDPLNPRVTKVVPLKDARAAALQFRYLFVTDRDGLHVFDVTKNGDPREVKSAKLPLEDARRIYLARTYAYVAGGRQGLAIVDIKQPESPHLKEFFTAGGQLNDTHDVVVATTNASLFAYVADGKNGLRVLQLTSPDSQPKFYGFSPEPHPELIATYPTSDPVLSVSKGLDRDRAVDETGHQIAILGRLGSRPFNQKEMETLYLDEKGSPWFTQDEPDLSKFVK